MKRIVISIVLLLLVIGSSYAVLSNRVVSVRPYLNSYLTDVEVTDSETGNKYNCRFSSSESPSEAEQATFASAAEASVQSEKDYDCNSLNLSVDENNLLEYYRNIKANIILQIRQYPAATLQQASDYVSSEYPNSPFRFDRLYDKWLDITGSSDWTQFKQFCIDHKFRGIDL